jgi:hypothetical protein
MLLGSPALAQNPKLDPKKPQPAPAGPMRDPVPAVAAIDRAWSKGLDEAKIAAAAEADDAEFLRRVTLDLTGRVPTWQQARAFLDNKDADKRRRLVDQLLAGPAFGQHFADVWRMLLAPPEEGAKPRPDILSPWLADQLNRNRPWSDIVRELLTAEGSVRIPELSFILTNSEMQRPKPEMLADATSRLFMGVELRCAQCHDHPFATWKQADFWSLAAFFSRTRPTTIKGGPNLSILEHDKPLEDEKGLSPIKGAALIVPAQTGNESGKLVRARFPRGEALPENVPMPYRTRLVDWLTARDNPWFARAAVNRFWAQLFGRGLVMPLDGFDERNPASNPELLDTLAKEFADSGYDLKHLLRCLTLSKAYQRTSAGRDPAALENFARMAVKPMGPEALYDSLAVVVLMRDKYEKPTAGKPGGKGAPVQDGSLPLSRDEFAKFFRSRGGDPNVINQGIPQALKLLNGPILGGGSPLIDRLCNGNTTREEAIETLYLAAYARRPRPAEMELFTAYLAKQPRPREGYTGMLWALLNSSEFLVNH